jgi:hypothetical protein
VRLEKDFRKNGILLHVFPKIILGLGMDSVETPMKTLQKNMLNRRSSKDHPCQVWFTLVQRFQRRRFRCEKLTDDGRQVMAKAHFAFGKVS